MQQYVLGTALLPGIKWMNKTKLSPGRSSLSSRHGLFWRCKSLGVQTRSPLGEAAVGRSIQWRLDGVTWTSVIPWILVSHCQELAPEATILLQKSFPGQASSRFGGPECGGSRVEGRESPSEMWIYINIRLAFIHPKRRPLTSGNSSLTSLEVLNPPTHLSPGGLSRVVTLFLLQGWACDPGRSKQSTSFSWP